MEGAGQPWNKDITAAKLVVIFVIKLQISLYPDLVLFPGLKSFLKYLHSS